MTDQHRYTGTDDTDADSGRVPLTSRQLRTRVLVILLVIAVLSSGEAVRARSPQAGQLAELLRARGASVTSGDGGTLAITGATSEVVGELARANGLSLQELSVQRASLEDRYMELTRESADYRAGSGHPPVDNPAIPARN